MRPYGQNLNYQKLGGSASRRPKCVKGFKTEAINPKTPKLLESKTKMDKGMLAADLEGLPEEDKHRMATLIDQLQIRDRFV